MYTPQLPHQPPFVVQADVSPAFQQYLPLATGYAMQLAMQNANISPFRQAFVSQLSQNNWQNPAFEQLVKMTAQFAEFRVNSSRYAPDNSIRYAADKMLNLLTAAFVNSNSQHFPQLRDPNVVNALHPLLRELNEIAAQVNSFYQRYGQPTMQVGYQQPAYGQAGNVPMQHAQVAYGSVSNYANQNLTSVNTVANAGNLGHMVAATELSPGVTYQKSGIEESFHMTPNTPIQKPTPAINPNTINVLQDIAETVTANWISTGDSEWPKIKNPQRPWDDVLMENGVEIRPAAISGWTVSKEAQPYVLTFDPGRQIKFHAKSPDGTIREVLLDWEDSMDYLAHELDLAVARKYAKSKNRNENVVFDPIQIVEINPDKNTKEVKDDPIAEALFAKAVNHRIIHGALLTNSFSEARRLLEIKIDGLEKFDENMPYEYTVDIIKDLLIYAKDQGDVEQLVNAKSFVELKTAYKEISDEVVKEFINDRLCARVNFELNNRMGVTWTIEDIIEDYPDVINELKSTYGQGVSEKLDKRFDRIVQHALPVVDLNSMDDEDIALICRLKGYSPDDITKDSMSVTFFTLRSSVTVLPYEYESLELELSEKEPRLLKVDKFKRLHSDITAIMDRNVSLTYPIQHRYLQFLDRRYVEITNGLLIPDSVLLRLSQLTE